ncbi:MAG: hypothetical protein QOD42_429 [Sphingomonadales bacterium]|nr:hypothetical protein [Sphingomonadales bacterium]
MDAEAQLDGFIDKYSAEVAANARALLARLKTRLPGARILVYDNYNALVIGFGASERVRDILLSIALYPRWINLFFMYGTALDDPHALLMGAGGQIRHVSKVTQASLDDPRVDALIAQAIDIAEPPIDPAAPQRLIVKSVSAKQRPRRPNA